MKPIHYFWKLIKYSFRYFATDMSTASVFWLSNTVLGLVLRAYFDFLTSDGTKGLPVNTIVGLQIGYAVISSIMLAAAILANTALRYRSMALMIRNIFSRILDLPGARSLPVDEDGQLVSSGQVISTFRDDTNNIVDGITLIEDAIGTGVTALISLVIMLWINPVITLGTFLPLMVIVGISQWLRNSVKAYRKASRTATSDVTGAIADMFTGIQALKVAGAEERIIANFEIINERRKQAMIKDTLLTQLITALSSGSMDFGVGFTLLLGASAIHRGEFTIGDFALFTAYIWPMTHLVRMVGGVITTYQQSTVALQRMENLMQGSPAGEIVAHHDIYMGGNYPTLRFPAKTDLHHLKTFEASGLGYVFPGTDHGIRDISFSIKRGSLTVITGKIGSGKTTLLKVLLGLLPADTGQILWNGQRVLQPDTFMVPPRCAYTGQVPRLFSDSLRNNILLGLKEENTNIQRAVQLAVLEKDVIGMEDGLDTQIGPRGMRLSGGQVQRTAAARMFIRDAELVIFDDLSSALDVETEQLLWQRLFRDNTATYLVVSHRRAVLQRADHIIVLQNGMVESEGTLQDLLIRSPEMRSIWGDESKTTSVAREK